MAGKACCDAAGAAFVLTKRALHACVPDGDLLPRSAEQRVDAVDPDAHARRGTSRTVGMPSATGPDLKKCAARAPVTTEVPRAQLVASV